jgi:predicted phosphodiesterase
MYLLKGFTNIRIFMFKNLFKKLFLVLVLSFVVTGSGYAKTIKFVQVSDVNYMLNYDGSEDSGHSKSILDSTVKDINGLKNVKFVVFTGDNIDKPSKELLYMFIHSANKLKVPYYVVIGDKEVFKQQQFLKKDYMAEVWKYSNSCHSFKPNYVFKKDGLIFIVVDGAKEVIPGSNGYYRKETLTWLDKKLTNYGKEKVVIFQHFPVVPPYEKESCSTYNVQAYKDMLKKHNNVIAIFSGHYHQNGEQLADGIYHASAPALIDDPHDYKVIEIETSLKSNPQIYTQLRHAE